MALAPINEGDSGVATRFKMNGNFNQLRNSVVGTNTNFPIQSSSSAFTAGQQCGQRTMHQLPQGGVGVRLVFVGGAFAGATENSLATGFPAKMAVAKEPAPWRGDVNYTAGEQVVYFADANNPYWVSLTSNTNSPPASGNTDWAAGTRPVTLPVTFDGAQDGSFSTQTLPDGTVVSRVMRISDPLPIDFSPGEWLGVYSWLPMSGVQVCPILGQSAPLRLGTWNDTGASVTDRTSTGGFGTARSSNASQFIPSAIIGVPASLSPSVVVIGDSISQGKTGTSGLSAVTIVSGGSGYKVCDILTLGRNGATAGAVAAGSDAKVIVDAVSSGVITSLRVIDAGGYTSTTSQTGQTLPTGTISLSGGSGSGASVTVTFGANPYDMGDEFGAQGYIARALASASIPHAMFAAAGDRCNLWTGGRSHSRMAAIAACNANTAYIALGRNDLSLGDSQATFRTNMLSLTGRLRGLGVKKIIGATITPETTSTSAAGCSSLADQSVTANNAVRLAVNAEMIATPAAYGFDQAIDVTSAIESAGKFIIIGGEPSAADGKHPGLSGIALMRDKVAASIGLFI